MTLDTKIRTKRYKDGRNCPVIFSKNNNNIYLPLFYPNLFIDHQLNSKAENTKKQALISIQCLLAWAARENIDIEKRMFALNLLDLTSESYNLKDAMLSQYTFLRDQAYRAMSRRDPAIAEIKVIKITPKRVANSSYNIRMTYISRYLSWLATLAASRLPYEEQKEAKKQISAQNKWFQDNHLLNQESNAGKPLTDQQEEILWSAIQPDSPENPWNQKLKFRNYLIVRTYLETGMRRGELMSIYANDLKHGEYKINLVKRRNNPRDSRGNKAEVKTTGRTLPITRELAQLLQNYILEDRRGKSDQSLKKARRHPFLFTSRTGAPIPMTSVTNIFEKLNRIGELDHISPHDLRYTFTEKLTKKLYNNQMNPALSSSFIKKTLGWSESSQMDAKYNEELRLKMVMEMAEERQKGFEHENK